MKINLVNPHQLPFPPTRGGGVENLNWLLAREFARQGHNVVAYSRLVDGLAPLETDTFGITHRRLAGYDRHPNRWIDHLQGLRYARNLYPILSAADVTSFHTPFSFLLRKKAGVGICTHTIHRTPKWPMPLYRKLDRLYCGSDAVVEQARAVDRRIRNLKRIYNCIALDDEPPVSRRDNKAGLLFLYVGRFVPDKGIASLVEGFELSHHEFPSNRLHTVGPQNNRDGANASFFASMTSYVQNRNLSNAVQFLPPVFDKKELNALFVRADVICMPSLAGETFSMAVLEAMAASKPVLVSDFPPMREAVDHMVTGYIARADDPASLADGIRFYSRNLNRLGELGLAGFQKARESFSVERITAEYLGDFQELINLKPASRLCGISSSGTPERSEQP